MRIAKPQSRFSPRTITFRSFSLLPFGYSSGKHEDTLSMMSEMIFYIYVSICEKIYLETSKHDLHEYQLQVRKSVK